MTALQWAVFPIVTDGDDKKPAVVGWRKVLPGQYPAHGDYGIQLTASDLVIDADPRNYPKGRNPLEELLAVFKLPQTRIVSSPRGGHHLYYKKPQHIKIKKTQQAYPGIDFLSEGHWVAGPGSATASGAYLLVQDMPPADLPQTFLAVLEPPAIASTKGVDSESLLMLDQYLHEVQTALPAIQGQRGDETTLRLALRGRDLGLPRDVVYELMRDHWNPLCQPPWDESDLYRKVTNAFTYARGAAGAASPEAVFGEFAPGFTHPSESPDAKRDNVVHIQTFQQDIVVQGMVPQSLTLDKHGNPDNTLSNVVYYLRHDLAWRGRLKFNEFSGQLEFVSRPDWRKRQLNEGTTVNKRDLSCMRSWFSSNSSVRMEISEATLATALEVAADPYHPVKDYLDKLNWDGRPRLDTLLHDTAGAEDSAYTRAVSRCLLIGAVKRIYEPGCKHDYVPILESKQGTKKSTWVAVLGGEWYSASELVRGDKDSYQNLRGRWFVELPEINATFSKADFNWLKGIISNATDVYRATYGHASRAVPRESVFVATINPSASHEYLRDEENRRYWPIKTGQFEIELLKKNRDQYFAEALHRYRQGEISWIVDERTLRAAEAAQEARREKDPWTEIFAGWAEQNAAGFTPHQAYAALGLNANTLRSHHRARLYSVLRELGFEYNRGAGTTGMWFKPEIWEGLR